MNLLVLKIEPCHRLTLYVDHRLTDLDRRLLWMIWLNQGDTLHVHVLYSFPMWLSSSMDTCSIQFNKKVAETDSGCGKWQIPQLVEQKSKPNSSHKT